MSQTIELPRWLPSHVLPSLRAAIAIRRFIARRGCEFDIIETSSWPGYFALAPPSAARLVVRLISSIGEQGVARPVMQELERRTVLRAHGLTAASDYIVRRLSKLYRLDLSHVQRVPLGIPDLARGGSVPKRSRVTFLSIATASHRKGTDVLMKALLPALEATSHFEVVLIGAGYDQFATRSRPLAAVWARIRSHFSHRVSLLGEISDDVKIAHLESSHYLLMTSRSESFGLPVIEAMRSGTPVIASGGGALPEVAGVSAANVIYSDPLDDRSLSAAILAAVQRGSSDASERGGLARAAFLEHYHEDAFLQRTVAAYRSFV